MIKKILLVVTTSLTLLSVSMVTPLVYAATNPTTNPRDAACSGLTATGVEVSCDQKTADKKFGDVLKTVINVLSIIVGAVSVIMIIIGGFRYVISGGDSNGVAGAKNTLIYAIIGLVVVLFAQTIVRFVLTRTK